MTDEQFREYLDTLGASTIANKAILACMLAGVPVTEKNFALAVGRWLDVSTPAGRQMGERAHRHFLSTIEARERLSPSAFDN